MQDGEPVAQGTHGDQAVDRGSNGQARGAGAAVEADGFLEDLLPKGRLDHGQCEHGVPGDGERRLLPETLQDLLEDRRCTTPE